MENIYFKPTKKIIISSYFYIAFYFLALIITGFGLVRGFIDANYILAVVFLLFFVYSVANLAYFNFILKYKISLQDSFLQEWCGKTLNQEVNLKNIMEANFRVKLLPISFKWFAFSEMNGFLMLMNYSGLELVTIDGKKILCPIVDVGADFLEKIKLLNSNIKLKIDSRDKMLLTVEFYWRTFIFIAVIFIIGFLFMKTYFI